MKIKSTGLSVALILSSTRAQCGVGLLSEVTVSQIAVKVIDLLSDRMKKQLSV